MSDVTVVVNQTAVTVVPAQGPGATGPQGIQGAAGEVTDAELAAGLALKANLAGAMFTGNVRTTGAAVEITGASGGETLDLRNPGVETRIRWRKPGTTTSRHLWQLVADGRLLFTQYTQAGAYEGAPIIFGNATTDGLKVSMAGATGGVVVPAASAATHAAQVSAIDAATGRLAIGGKEVGDTGWRAMPFVNGWTGFAIRLRRLGNLVMLSFNDLNGSAATSIEGPGANHFVQIPAGFRDNYKSAMGFAYSDVGPTQTIVKSANTSLYLPNHATYRWNGTITWSTDEAWPTSLPGSAG